MSDILNEEEIAKLRKKVDEVGVGKVCEYLVVSRLALANAMAQLPNNPGSLSLIRGKLGALGKLKA